LCAASRASGERRSVALATDLRSPDARDAAHNAAVGTYSIVAAVDRRSPEAVPAPASAKQAATIVVDRTSPEGRGTQGIPDVHVVSVGARDGFDWGDAGIGAGTIAGLALLAVAAGGLVAHRRHRPTGKSVLSS